MKIPLLKSLFLISLVTLSAGAQELEKSDEKPLETPVKKGPPSKAKLEGEAFLAKNAKAEGITVLPDGLQYRILKEGNGPAPTTNDLVFIKYRGKFIEGGEFDHNNHFLTRTCGGIPGWQEALQKMKVGSKWQVFIPSEMAFGEEGDPYHHIAPDTTLSYDLEILSIAQPGDPQVGTGALGHGLSGQETIPVANFKPGVVGSEVAPGVKAETNSDVNPAPAATTQK
jgi:FKBP-type peptidyl-prolyl cis-trans isomerase